MADYQCHPIWSHGGFEVGNIDPRDLGISEDLVDGFDEWRGRYDNTLCENDPVSSGFAREEEMDEFVAEGRFLAMRLAKELGDNFSVYYFDEKRQVLDEVDKFI